MGRPLISFASACLNDCLPWRMPILTLVYSSSHACNCFAVHLQFLVCLACFHWATHTDFTDSMIFVSENANMHASVSIQDFSFRSGTKPFIKVDAAASCSQ